MSRYTATSKATGRDIAWGYDRPLREYFITEFKRPDEQENEDDEYVYSIMSHTTTCPHPDHPMKMDWSNSEILELMNQHPEIPETHKDAVAMDLPY